MATREEIREGMIELLKDGVTHDTPYGETADKIMLKEASQGVVIKVEANKCRYCGGEIAIFISEDKHLPIGIDFKNKCMACGKAPICESASVEHLISK